MEQQKQKPFSMKSIDRHEAPCSTSAAATATAKAAAASSSARRKVHVVYYLNRGGHVDQPHLIEGSIATDDNLYLKDFKRWLAMARGSSMPGTFSWAYKRNYGRGGGFFIWHDVFDDEDPIFPLQQRQYTAHFPAAASSNNTTAMAAAAAEYVLMGSEMPNNNNVSISPPAAAQLPFASSCSMSVIPIGRGTGSSRRHAELLVPCRKEIILSSAAAAAGGDRLGTFDTAANAGFDCRSGVDRHRGRPLADGSFHRPSLDLCASTSSLSRPAAAAASYWRCQDIDVVPATAPPPPEHYHGATSYGGIFASGSARSDSGSFVYSYRASVHSRDSGCDAEEHPDVAENDHDRAETPAAAVRSFKAMAAEKVSDAATQTGSADSRRTSTDGIYAFVGAQPSNAADSPPIYAVKSCGGGDGGGTVISTRDRRNYALDQEVLNRSPSSASAAEYRQADGTMNMVVRYSSASLTEQSFGNVDDGGGSSTAVPTNRRSSQRLPLSNSIQSRTSNSQRLQLPMPSGDECPIDRGASFTAAAAGNSSCRNRKQQQQQPGVVSGRNSGRSCTAEAAEMLYSAGSSSLYNGSAVLETCTASPSSARSFRSINSASHSTRFSGSYNGEGGAGYGTNKGGARVEDEVEMERARSSKGKLGSMVRWEVLQQFMLFRCRNGGGKGGTAAEAAMEEEKKQRELAEDRKMMKRSPSSVKPSKSPFVSNAVNQLVCSKDFFDLGHHTHGHNTTTPPSPSLPSCNSTSDHLPCPYSSTNVVIVSSSSPSSLTSYPSRNDLLTSYPSSSDRQTSYPSRNDRQNSCLDHSDRQISNLDHSDRQDDNIFMPPPPASPSSLDSTTACFRSWFCPQFYPTFKSHRLPPHHPLSSSQLVPPNLIHKHGIDLLMPIGSTPTSTSACATVSPCDPLQDINSSKKLLHLISSPLVDTKYNCP